MTREPVINKIKNTINNNRCFMIILLIGIVIRTVWLFVLAYNESFSYAGNIDGYIKNAESVVNEGHLIYDGFRTPGYPLIISAFMLISKTYYYLLVCIFQNILNVIAVCAVYQIVIMLVDSNKAACIGATIAVLNFHDIYFADIMLTDSVAQSLTIFSRLFLIMFLHKENSGKKAKICYLCVCAVLLSFALSVRPSLLFLPVAYVLGLVFVVIRRKKYRWIIPVILIVSIICYTPVCAWTIRNKTVADYNGYSTVSSINLYCYNSAAVYSKQNNMDYNETVEYLKQGKDKKYQEYLKSMDKYKAMDKRAKEIIFSDVPCYVKRCAIDVAALELYPGALSFNGVKESYETVISNVKQNGVSALFEKNGLAESSWLFVIVIDCLLLLMLFVLSVIGAIKLIRKCWVPAVFLIGTVLYNIIICCQPVGYGSYPRFRLSFSMISIILVACSFGIRTIKSKKSKNKASAESDQA